MMQRVAPPGAKLRGVREQGLAVVLAALLEYRWWRDALWLLHTMVAEGRALPPHALALDARKLSFVGAWLVGTPRLARMLAPVHGAHTRATGQPAQCFITSGL